MPAFGNTQLKLLEKLCNVIAVSGDEGEVRRIVLEEIKPYADDVRVDALGSVLATRCGQGKKRMRVMIDAHMDEVGFMIVAEDGEGLWLYALSICYLMLFNPRTENNTYAMLGPAIAVFCGQALLIERRPKVAAALAAAAIGILGSHRITQGITPPPQAVWLAPLVCTGFLAYLVRTLTARKGGPAGAAEPSPS